MNIIIDCETRSKTPLQSCGSWIYSIHHSTDVLCMAYKIDNDITKMIDFRNGYSIPPDLKEALDNNATIEAFNVQFEYAIWTNILVERHNWPRIDLNRFRCTQARALQFALPRSLEAVSDALELPTTKDKEGKLVMQQMCKPKKPSKKDPSIWYDDDIRYEKLIKYCIQDVEVTYNIRRKLIKLAKDRNYFINKVNKFTPKELEIFDLNNEINLRGVKCDSRIANKALHLIHQHEEILNKELQEITDNEINTSGQVKKILEIFHNNKIYIPNLQSSTIDEWIKRTDGKFRRILEIRQQLSKSSTKKIKAMIDRCDEAHRIRDLLLYYGASRTGRFSGTGIQVQNFIRPSISAEEMEIAFNMLSDNSSYNDFASRFPNVLEAISSCLRGMLIPKENHVFLDSDFSAIEARVLFWLANDKLGLQMYYEGIDIYKAMASKIYDIPIKNITKDFRQLGKQAILGCFGQDTKIITMQGVKSITRITKDDLIWDGIEWVKSEGCIYQGVKEVIECQGVKVTKDHEYLIKGEWVPVGSVAQEEKLESLILASKEVNLPLKDISKELEEDLKNISSHVSVNPNLFMKLIHIILAHGSQLDVTHAQNKKALKLENDITNMLKLYPMMNIEKDCLIDYHQQFLDAITQIILTITTMAVEEYTSNATGEITDPCFYNMSSLYLDGIKKNLKWIGSMLTKDMLREIYVLFQNQKICQTNDKYRSYRKKSTNYEETYDILNCGPRNRFVVLTADGHPQIVHNCGYGMGSKKFLATCKGYNMDISEDLASKAVSAYREKFYKIPQYWKEIERSALQSIANPNKSIQCGKVHFYTFKDFMYICLPSGRTLAYNKPRIQRRYGNNYEVIYNGYSSQIKKFEEQKTWGGKLVENITQAVARDFMAEAMLRINPHYPVVFTVHDQVLSEVHKDNIDLDHYTELMEVIPEWGEGCPIKAESNITERFQK